MASDCGVHVALLFGVGGCFPAVLGCGRGLTPGKWKLCLLCISVLARGTPGSGRARCLGTTDFAHRRVDRVITF